MNQRADSWKKKFLANRKDAKITGAFWFLSHTSYMAQPEMEGAKSPLRLDPPQPEKTSQNKNLAPCSSFNPAE
ncbi:hypothetical protein ACFFWD_28455 [Bradyrhizobium erythrophlei]|uniref:hypothetical protein n=1 Tax=Bradyrhizobium erythrophlei TaxID=1437360 RepID=UPI0035EF3939